MRLIIILCGLLFIHAARAEDECQLLPKVNEKQIIVGWLANARTTTQWSASTNESMTTTLGDFRIVAAIEGGIIKGNIGSSIKNGQSFWSVSDDAQPVQIEQVSSFLDRMNREHCVYSASISAKNIPKFSLFTSKKFTKLREPTKSEKASFYKFNSTCIDQGDYDNDMKPPCTKPSLLAVSDINNNDSIEYWASEPYMWDDGLTVWEKSGDSLVPIIQVCVGCSD